MSYLKYLAPLVLTIIIVIVFKSFTNTDSEKVDNLIEAKIQEQTKPEKIIIKNEKGTFTRDIATDVWPTEIPSQIPEFKYGRIMSVACLEKEVIKNWVIILEKVQKHHIQKYKQQLENVGYKVDYKSYNDTDAVLTAERGKIALGIIVGKNDSCFTIDVGG